MSPFDSTPEGVPAGAAPALATKSSEPSYFGRLPEHVMPRRDLKSGPKFLLAVLDQLWRRSGERGIDATDPQLAALCGCSINTISAWLKSLANLGLIERIGRTCSRIIRLVTQFRTRTHQDPLPQKSGGIPPENAVNFPRNGGELTQVLGASSEYQSEAKEFRARSSSSSGRKSRTTTTAKDPSPPSSAAPPLREPSAEKTAAILAEQRREAAETAARDRVLKARWENMSEANRERIKAHVTASNPNISRWPLFVETACLEAMDPANGLVDAVPSDRELRSLKMLAFADDLNMRLAARSELDRLGRADIYAQ